MSGHAMRVMVFHGVGHSLALEERPVPEPGAGEILVRVAACGVCRTDLHLVDGELSAPRLRSVPGHEVVSRVAALGSGVERFGAGERVEMPGMGWTCGMYQFCRQGLENLCGAARFTGYTRDGGCGQYGVADQRCCLHLPSARGDEESVPLLCAGLIGYRALQTADDGTRTACGPHAAKGLHDAPALH